MPTMAEVRAKYPQYNDISDDDLATALHRKFYADMPEAEFRKKIGLDVNTTAKTDRLPMTATAQLKDAGASLATGVREGIESAAGQFGDAANMQGNMAGWVAGKLGAGPDTQEMVRKWAGRITPNVLMPSTQDIRAAVTEPIVKATGTEDVLDHTPQTVAGEYMRTGGRFVSGAVAPGGIVRKAASVIIPAAASETAGQLTKGTAAEPYARLAAGLAGGVATMGGAPSAVVEAASGAPTTMQLKQQTDKLYSALRDAGIKYDADSFAKTVQDMAQELHDAGLRPSIAKEAHGVVNELINSIGQSPDFSDINGLVSSLGEKARDLRRAGQNQEAKGIDVIRDHLMDFEAKAPMVSRVPLPREEFNTLRKTARDTARRTIQARSLDEIAENADAYAAGQEAGLRQGLRNLVKSKRGKQLFNQTERAALLQVANGRKPLQTLSRFGLDITKWNGSATFMPTMTATAVGAGLGPLAGGSLLAAGTAAKLLSPRLTSKAFEAASSAIRSGKLRDGTVMPAVKAKWLQKVVRGYLTTEAASSASQPSEPSRPLEITVHPLRQASQP